MPWIKSPTPEGLIVSEKAIGDGVFIIEEIGKLDYVVYRYWYWESDELGSFFGVQDDLIFLLERISEAETRCRDLAQRRPAPIDLSQWTWNRKAASRRFRRIVSEQDIKILEGVPAELRLVARRMLDLAAEAQDISVDPVDDFLLAAQGSQNWGKVVEYVRAKRSVPTIVFSDHIPQALREMLLEAQEAYFWGLNRAVPALCRAILEELAEQVFSFRTAQFTARSLDAKSILAQLPDRLLNAKGRDIALKIWNEGNSALHESSFSGAPWQTLVKTLRVVEAVANRGGLGELAA